MSDDLDGPTAATTDEAPSPWWPCPECGGAHFRVICVFERGEWVDEDTYVHHDPPSGTPTAIDVGVVTCVLCGHRFDIARHYGWGSAGS